jgi:hypothetical protein
MNERNMGMRLSKNGTFASFWMVVAMLAALPRILEDIDHVISKWKREIETEGQTHS